jgi:catechol 2,3-dioxygenase-like lactoylglutathione lyase family enzyme
VIDHVLFDCDDFDASREFYEMALAPLGIEVVSEPAPQMVGFGEGGKPYFWLMARGRPTTQHAHIAFAAPDRDAVDTFHAAGLAAGGSDNGAPGPRPIYHAAYYGAFVLDPAGNNIEAACHDAPVD